MTNSGNLPKVSHSKSIKVKVEEGKKYFWCACGLSANQPFCDGKHAGTGFFPISYKANETKIVGFCGCKMTKNQPMCDGAHKQLAENQ